MRQTGHRSPGMLEVYARENAHGQVRSRALPTNVHGVLERMKSWFQGNF